MSLWRLVRILYRWPRIHRVVHRDSMTACPICRYVWRRLEEQPGFNERMAAARAELESRGGVRYSMDEL